VLSDGLDVIKVVFDLLWLFHWKLAIGVIAHFCLEFVVHLCCASKLFQVFVHFNQDL